VDDPDKLNLNSNEVETEVGIGIDISASAGGSKYGGVQRVWNNLSTHSAIESTVHT
jgi:hypothetical protein